MTKFSFPIHFVWWCRQIVRNNAYESYLVMQMGISHHLTTTHVFIGPRRENVMWATSRIWRIREQSLASGKKLRFRAYLEAIYYFQRNAWWKRFWEFQWHQHELKTLCKLPGIDDF